MLVVSDVNVFRHSRLWVNDGEHTPRAAHVGGVDRLHA